MRNAIKRLEEIVTSKEDLRDWMNMNEGLRYTVFGWDAWCMSKIDTDPRILEIAVELYTKEPGTMQKFYADLARKRHCHPDTIRRKVKIIRSKKIAMVA